jgi:hypothetical protein
MGRDQLRKGRFALQAVGKLRRIRAGEALTADGYPAWQQKRRVENLAQEGSDGKGERNVENVASRTRLGS